MGDGPVMREHPGPFFFWGREAGSMTKLPNWLNFQILGGRGIFDGITAFHRKRIRQG